MREVCLAVLGAPQHHQGHIHKLFHWIEETRQLRIRVRKLCLAQNPDAHSATALAFGFGSAGAGLEAALAAAAAATEDAAPIAANTAGYICDAAAWFIQRLGAGCGGMVSSS